MTIKDFIKIYTSSDNVLQICDATYELFSEKLPKEFFEELDPGEVILEALDHYLEEKEFEKAVKFTELIQKKHSSLYRKYFQYFDAFLIDYHCFHKNIDKAEESFSNYFKNPKNDYDKLLLALEKLIYYQSYNIPDKTIIHIHDAIKNSRKLIPGSEADLDMYKFYINLENYYNNYEKKKIFEKEVFAESLLDYSFKLQDQTLLSIEKGLFNPDLSPETIIDSFTQDRDHYNLTIKCQFMKEMAEKKFNFVLSGTLWEKLFIYWEEQTEKKKQKPDEYFIIKTDKFEHYLEQLAGNYFINNRSMAIAVLWGSVYIYDFLLSIGLISNKTYDSFKYTSKILKGKVIGQITSELWNSNFIHQWTKPDSILSCEFEEEERIFLKSYFIKPCPFSQFRNEISEELESIGELSKYIIMGGKNTKLRSNSILDNLFDSMQNKLEPGKEGNKGVTKEEELLESGYVTLKPKIGRNAPCPCGSGKKYKKCCLNK